MKNILFAFRNVALGIVLGLVMLEATLQVNPGLLFRGMVLPAPIDAPISQSEYDVRYSDADAFYWRPDLIRPVSPEDDQIESHVLLKTDEFGFRNQPPLPEKSDVAVLGRSISLAAHLPAPWPQLLAEETGLQVLNLSQPGGGISLKLNYLMRYGFPRHPKIVIVEVVPSIDIIGGEDERPFLTEKMVYPLIQALWKRYFETQTSRPTGKEIYPIQESLPGRSVNLTCCLHYLDFFTLNNESIQKSNDWKKYQSGLLTLIAEAKKRSVCVALLFVPTKPDVYFPLASEPNQLDPTLREIVPYRLNQDGTLTHDPAQKASVDMIQRNAYAGRDVIRSFALQYRIPLIDPTESLQSSVLDGKDPFMIYDSHWNELGHELVTKDVIKYIQNSDCH